MIFDTDILIWIQRGNQKAAEIVQHAGQRMISAQTYMELLQGAEHKRQQSAIKDLLHGAGFQILPITAPISQRAMIYVEEYSLSHGLRAGDAIVGATAAETNRVLATGNGKHYKAIRDLELKIFRP